MPKRSNSKGRGLPPRQHKIQLRLNDKEYKALKEYAEQYGILHKAEWIRELVMAEIIGRIERDTPLLFSEDEMRSL